jgi:serine/threonine protein phosphatase PrpC
VPRVVCSIREAIRRGFEDMDREVIRTTEQKGDSSGSCAVVIILLYNRVFIAHAGDTRAVLGQVKGLFLIIIYYLLYCFIYAFLLILLFIYFIIK